MANFAVGFDRESYFLSLLEKEAITKGLGDDCCIVNLGYSIHNSSFLQTFARAYKHKAHIHAQDLKSLVIGADSFCEGVHFLKSWFSPYELAQKAFLVNYSDIIAMNAKPLYATLSVALPKSWQKVEIREFVNGIAHFCRTHHIALIGGDTIGATSLQIHITLFAKAHKHTLYRDKIPPKSLIYYTCDTYPKYTITQSYKLLKTLLHRPKNKHLRARGRFLFPRLRDRFIADCASFLKGGMDISDGILSDVSKLGVINKLHFKPNMPLFAPHLKPLLYSGESYEMLVAIAPKDRLRLKRIALKHRIKVCNIGEFTRKKYMLPPIKYWH